jgi:hypothetical protein
VCQFENAIGSPHWTIPQLAHPRSGVMWPVLEAFVTISPLAGAVLEPTWIDLLHVLG